MPIFILLFSSFNGMRFVKFNNFRIRPVVSRLSTSRRQYFDSRNGFVIYHFVDPALISFDRLSFDPRSLVSFNDVKPACPHQRLLIGGCRFALDFTGFSLVSYCIQGYSIRGLIEFCFLLNRAVVKYCCTL